MPCSESSSEQEEEEPEEEVGWSMILKIFAAATRAFANATMLGTDWPSASPPIMTKNMGVIVEVVLRHFHRSRYRNGPL
jgi:hypothetical protein